VDESKAGQVEVAVDRLRRPLVARLFASGLQLFLTFVAVITIPVLGLTIWKGDLAMWPFLLVDVLLVALWLRGVTAWAQADDEGLRWRYWARWDHPWSKISRVTLTRHSNTFAYHAAGPPIILVRAKGGDEDFIVPARGCGRHRREFGSAVLAAARAHGVRTEVTSTGWDEKPDEIAEPWT
jgi:hypothetical protein